MKPHFLLSILLLTACVQNTPSPLPGSSSSSSSRSSSSSISGVVHSSAASSRLAQSSSTQVVVVSSLTSSAAPRPSVAQNPIVVPFTVQAPFANWEDPYQEACEEASLLMVHHFLLGNRTLTAEAADADLLSLIKYEEENGFSEDVTIEELAVIARNFYGYKAIVEKSVTVARIEQLLDEGHPVIVPAAGRKLGNPYFSGEGPWYHMLVITGYDGSSFITNDPGTKRGAGYRYDKDVLLSAIHDWTGVKEDIENGEKALMVVQKP